jgi:hypothetical protein
VIRPAIRHLHRHPFARADERTGRLQKQPRRLDGDGVTGVVMMQVRIAADFVQMLLVIDGSRDQFAGVGDRAEQPHTRKRYRRGADRQPGGAGDDFVEVGHQQVVTRQRIPGWRQHVERRGDVAHVRAVDDA